MIEYTRDLLKLITTIFLGMVLGFIIGRYCFPYKYKELLGERK